MTVSGTVYLLLAVSWLWLLVQAPAVGLLWLTDLSRSWLLLAGLASLMAPATAAAFVVFASFSQGDVAIAGGFIKAWRQQFKRSWPLGLAYAGVAVVLGAEWWAVAHFGWAQLALVPLLLASALVLASVPISCQLLVAAPQLRRRQVVKVAVAVAVRRWFFSLLNLAAMAVAGIAVSAQPVLALLLLPAPLLYLLWASARHLLTPIQLSSRLGEAEPPASKGL
jgi:uncharacterized membrane protein YesL